MREIDGRFIAGSTEEEVRTRYDLCADLVSQLKTYCERKHRENPDLDRLALLQKVRVGVRQKGWDLSEAELDWVMEQLGLLPIDATPRTLVPWQVAPAWLEAFLVRANNAPPVKGQLRTMLEAARERSARV